MWKRAKMSQQMNDLKVGDLLFLSQGIWLRSEKHGTYAKQIEQPCLGVVVEKDVNGVKTLNSYKTFTTSHYKICVGDEMYLLDEDNAHKYVRDNGN